MKQRTDYSIITATYNAARFMERAIASILGQSYPHFEWIIQDGGSTDGTLDILARYPDRRISLGSEPDTGVFAAWNKGVARAAGEWCIFLGADDMFINEHSLAKCHYHLKRMGPETSFAYAAMVRGHNLRITETNNFALFDVYHRFSNRLGPPMPSLFIRTALLRQSPFDERYKISADFDFVARYYTGDNIARIPVMAVYMEQGGLSSNPAQRDLMFAESRQILSERILPKAEAMMRACIDHYYDRDDHLEE
ncbi:MAG: glycosyltransferase [Desulfovibrio sp.]|jgi:glycosyltransferase involved in cell wall biosynthesis|nr:glycosyltransferase [Desulfovibrio sp.]